MDREKSKYHSRVDMIDSAAVSESACGSKKNRFWSDKDFSKEARLIGCYKVGRKKIAYR